MIFLSYHFVIIQLWNQPNHPHSHPPKTLPTLYTFFSCKIPSPTDNQPIGDRLFMYMLKKKSTQSLTNLHGYIKYIFIFFLSQQHPTIANFLFSSLLTPRSNFPPLLQRWWRQKLICPAHTLATAVATAPHIYT